MTHEESIVQNLVGKFAYLAGRVQVQRVRRIIASVDQGQFEEVFTYAQRELQFSVLCTITGLDEGPTMGFIYQMARADGIVFSLKFSVPKDKPVIQTMTRYFPPADIYERELMDLLGAQVEGLGPGNRYPLPDDWPKDEYPLRKDWKAKTAGTNTEEIKQNA